MRLDVPVKVAIARVVEILHCTRRASGLGQPTTFETIQECLSQIVFLQTSPGDATTSFREVQCNRGSRVAPIFTDAAVGRFVETPVGLLKAIHPAVYSKDCGI